MTPEEIAAQNAAALQQQQQQQRQAPADFGDQMERALRRQPKNVTYPDYKTTEDFTLWLSGYLERTRSTHGYGPHEDGLVQAEIVRAISGKLSVGNALDAYNRLSRTEKADYKTLIERLTEEFVDPQEKRLFNESLSFNKRKKGQSVKGFMQEIKNDMQRYSTLQKQLITISGGLTTNPEIERQGVVRFRHGMRNEKGKKDSDLSDHLNYHLMEDSELTWKNAIEVTSRWEMAKNRRKKSKKAESSSDSSDSSDDEVESVEVKKKSSKSKKGKEEDGKVEKDDSLK